MYQRSVSSYKSRSKSITILEILLLTYSNSKSLGRAGSGLGTQKVFQKSCKQKEDKIFTTSWLQDFGFLDFWIFELDDGGMQKEGLQSECLIRLFFIFIFYFSLI